MTCISLPHSHNTFIHAAQIRPAIPTVTSSASCWTSFVSTFSKREKKKKTGKVFFYSSLSAGWTLRLFVLCVWEQSNYFLINLYCARVLRSRLHLNTMQQHTELHMQQECILCMKSKWKEKSVSMNVLYCLLFGVWYELISRYNNKRWISPLADGLAIQCVDWRCDCVVDVIRWNRFESRVQMWNSFWMVWRQWFCHKWTIGGGCGGGGGGSSIVNNVCSNVPQCAHTKQTSKQWNKQHFTESIVLSDFSCCRFAVCCMLRLTIAVVVVVDAGIVLAFFYCCCCHYNRDTPYIQCRHSMWFSVMHRKNNRKKTKSVHR